MSRDHRIVSRLSIYDQCNFEILSLMVLALMQENLEELSQKGLNLLLDHFYATDFCLFSKPL